MDNSTGLSLFFKSCDEHRRRFKEDGIALTRDEAVETYKLMAPAYPPLMDPEAAERQTVWNAIICHETGRFKPKAVMAIIEGFEREIAEGSSTLCAFR